MQVDYDLAIIGSGFGGSLLSMVARRAGLSVILIERGRHPRFAIGESTSPLANLIIEQLAERYDLPRLIPLTTYGQWQRAYPNITCGLKRGFTYFKHEAGSEYKTSDDRSNQLLVAASPDDDEADTHWLRADVDHFLVNEAISTGVDYIDRTSIDTVEFPPGAPVILRGERRGRSIKLQAGLLIDASGPNGFLSRKLSIPDNGFAGYPQTATLYSHFTGVRRCDEMEAYKTDGTPPYSIDDAAEHHVFDGGWMWVLRFNNGVTSVGIAVRNEFGDAIGISEGAKAWDRFLSFFPTIADQFAPARPVLDFVYSPKLSHRCATAAGDHWAMLPHTAAFVDPLFSTGIPLTLLGIERLGSIFESGVKGKSLNDRLREYSAITLFEADRVAEFIAACNAAMPRFENFVSYSMFYFAAASFSEMARRVGRRELVRRFLATDHPQFGPSMRECGRMILDGCSPDFARKIKSSIDPLNIAGLSDPAKMNWYPVDLEDVVVGAHKLGFTIDEMRDIVERMRNTRK